MIPQNSDTMCNELEMHGAEIFLAGEMRGGEANKGSFGNGPPDRRGYSLNTLGIARRIIPQQDKEDSVKGASFVFITNGRTRNTLEMLSNQQACSRATRSLLDARAECSSSVCPENRIQSGKRSSGKPHWGVF